MARFIRSSLVVALMIGSAGAPAFAQKATDDLSLLPVDSELVAGLDFQALQSSQLWKQFVEPRLQKNDIKKNFDEFKATCGMDPMKVLTKISIGMKGIGSDKPDGTIVVHGVTKTKMIVCYAAL